MNDVLLDPPRSRGFRARLGALRFARETDDLDHPSVLERVKRDGGWTHRYAFMTLMSAGIAMLGLLLGSPAVVIGAMLVSPLMGPIIGLGFALAVFDWPEVRRSLIAVLGGAALATSFAAAIVLLSPLQDATSEILARTRPNLFDLLVAIFSALAGTYATVRGRGEAIVGVAIATALMPPLAVVGYGIAIWNLSIFSGAFGLFLTNFLAISLAATAVARFYGFASHLSPDQTRKQTWALSLVFLGLAAPLAWSLQQIAWETWATRTARAAISDEFGDQGRIGTLEPVFGRQEVTIRARVFTEAFRTRAASDLERRLTTALGRPVTVDLGQIVINQNISRTDLDRARTVVDREANAIAVRQELALRLAAAANTDPSQIVVDPTQRMATVRAVGARNLSDWRATEVRIASGYPDWQIAIVPPVTDLPGLIFDERSAELDDTALARLRTIAWALGRWGVDQVTLVGGRASNEPATLAAQRADAVAERLRSVGIEVLSATPSALDRAREREEGLRVSRTVRITPAGAREPEVANQEAPPPTQAQG